MHDDFIVPVTGYQHKKRTVYTQVQGIAFHPVRYIFGYMMTMGTNFLVYTMPFPFSIVNKVFRY